MNKVRANYVIEIATPTPRRITPYRGRAANGLRGLIVDAVFFQAAIVEVPEIEESDAVAPVRVSLQLGNALGVNTPLFSDSVNFAKPITIRKVVFDPGTVWEEAFAPTCIVKPWFDGLTGTPSLRGERVVIECHAEMGRRGMSPRTKSRSLMLSHQPLSADSKIPIIVRT
ncbi:MAG: hypothetical protein ACXW28_10360 [Thermoanaerobaculia bacterium]